MPHERDLVTRTHRHLGHDPVGAGSRLQLDHKDFLLLALIEPRRPHPLQIQGPIPALGGMSASE